MVNESLVEGMDELLSADFPGDEIIRINKIEIDLGNLTTEELEKHFIDKCMAEFTRTIKKIPLSKKQEAEEERSTVSKEENTIVQFVSFLSSGKMYWAAVNMNFQQWQTEIAEAIKKNPFFLIQQLDAVVKNSVTTERLVTQFDNTLIQLVVQLYQPHIKNEFELLIQLLRHIFSQNNYSIPGKNILIKLLPVLFKPLPTVGKNDFEHLMREITVSSKNIELAFALQLREAILALFEKLNTGAAIKLKHDVFNEVSTAAISTDVRATGVKQEEKNEAAAEESSTYINNAGLVILHPFLQNFFITTALMQGDNFSSDIAAQTAVHLLQYLANGEQQAPEYIMPLNKILCGIDEEQHIDRFIQLEEKQLKEAVALLQAVVEHWEILKNTSVEGLQETFFQRKGKLSFNATDGFWKLQVERKALDILLDKIPWGISYIKLPWMKYPLITEW